jgi:hypothetical protein
VSKTNTTSVTLCHNKRKEHTTHDSIVSQRNKHTLALVCVAFNNDSEQKAGIRTISKWTFATMHNEALPPGVTNTTSFVDLASLARTMSVPKSLSASSKASALSLTAALQREDSATYSDKDDDTTTGNTHTYIWHCVYAYTIIFARYAYTVCYCYYAKYML